MNRLPSCSISGLVSELRSAMLSVHETVRPSGELALQRAQGVPLRPLMIAADDVANELG